MLLYGNDRYGVDVLQAALSSRFVGRDFGEVINRREAPWLVGLRRTRIGLTRRVRGSIGLVEVVMGGEMDTVTMLAPSELASAPSESGTGATLSIGASLRASK